MTMMMTRYRHQVYDLLATLNCAVGDVPNEIRITAASEKEANLRYCWAACAACAAFWCGCRPNQPFLLFLTKNKKKKILTLTDRQMFFLLAPVNSQKCSNRECCCSTAAKFGFAPCLSQSALENALDNRFLPERVSSDQLNSSLG